MSQTTRLSTQGRVTIPKAVRIELALVPGTRFEIRADNGGFMLQPLKAPEIEKEEVAIHQPIAADD